MSDTRLAWHRTLVATDAGLVGMGLAMAFLGEWFYRVPVGPAFLTELVLLVLGIVALGAALAARKVSVRWPLLALLALYGAYGLYAVAQGRPSYWVARQLALPYYALAALVALQGRANVPKWLAKSPLTLIGVGLVTLAGHRADLIPGQSQFPGMLVLLAGLAWYLHQPRRAVIQVATLAALLALVGLLNHHSTFLLAIAATAGASWAMREGRTAIPVIAAVAMLGLPVLASSEAATDTNATWRYDYWIDVLHESWDRGVVFGQGVGEPFIDDDYPHYERVSTQVGGHVPGSNQDWMVPPHNGVLTLLLQVGLLGPLLFLWPPTKSIVAVWRRPDSAGAPFVAWFAGALTILLSNQFLEVPYCAVPFWAMMGWWWQAERAESETAAATSQSA